MISSITETAARAMTIIPRGTTTAEPITRTNMYEWLKECPDPAREGAEITEALVDTIRQLLVYVKDVETQRDRAIEALVRA